MKTRIKQLRDIAENAAARQSELLLLAGKENRSLTEAEQAEFDDLGAKADKALADIVPLNAVVARMAAADAVVLPADRQQRDATGVTDRIQRGGGTEPVADERHAEAERVFADPKDPEGWKKKIAAYAWAVAKNKASPRFTPLEHLERAGCQILVDESKAAEEQQAKDAMNAIGGDNPVVLRALTSLTGGGGDNAITTPLSSEWIDFLRATSAFMRGGPNMIPMPLGSLQIAGGNAGASGTYHAENADLGYTQATTRKVNMVAKHIGAVTAMSNYMIDISPLALPAIIGDDLVNGIVQGIDSAGQRGDGTGDNPTGILSLVNAAHKAVIANGTGVAPTLAQIDADAKAMIVLLDAALIPVRRRRWQMSSRVFRYLQFMRDGISGYVYPGLQNTGNPTWYDGYPVIVSDLIPSNLGAGTNESELYLTDFGHVMMGETRSLRLKASTEASYKNAGGTLVSAFAKDETVIRGMASHDFDMRYDKAAVIRTAVKWGA